MSSSFYLWSQWKAKVCAETFQTATHFQECAIDACNSVASDSTGHCLTGYLFFICVSAIMVDTLNTFCEHKLLSSFVGAFVKLLKATISFAMSVRLSVRLHGTSRLPLDGFSWNLAFEGFSKICRDNSRFIKKRTRILGNLHEDQYTFFYHIAPISP
jgi:hypothetical protein